MSRWTSVRMATLATLLICGLAGCAAPLATLLWVVRGNPDPAAFDGLQKKQVVVLCRAAPGLRYSAMLASKEMTRSISMHLQQNVSKIKMIPPEKILGRIDEWGDEDPVEIATELGAEKLVLVEIESFSLYAGSTLYEGRANYSVQVYDLVKGTMEWERPPAEAIYPPNTGLPISTMPEANFRRKFQAYLTFQVGKLFHPYERQDSFASDVDAVLR